MLKLLPRHYGKILYEVTKDVPEKKLDEAVRSFLRFISERHVLRRMESIMEHFIDYAREQEGIKKIEIVSARTLSQAVVEKIKTQFGKKVEEKMLIDKSIIGGIAVRVDNLILDGSLKTRLTQLREKLLMN